MPKDQDPPILDEQTPTETQLLDARCDPAFNDPVDERRPQLYGRALSNLFHMYHRRSQTPSMAILTILWTDCPNTGSPEGIALRL